MGMLASLAKVEALLDWIRANGWQKVRDLAMVLITCFLILWVVRLMVRAVRKAVDDGNDALLSDAERRAETLGAVLNNTAWVITVGFFVVMTLREFGMDIRPFLAGAGIAGLALGFGAQSLVKDVISGFFLLFDNQYGVGDTVSLDDKHTGKVERMTLRITQLRDGEGRVHYLPNGSFNKVIVLSKDFSKAMVDVEISSEGDVDHAMDVIRDVGKELVEAWPDQVMEPTFVAGIEAMDATSCTVRTYTKTAPGMQSEVAREIRRRILLRFRTEGILMPLPTRVVVSRGEGAAAAAESLDAAQFPEGR